MTGLPKYYSVNQSKRLFTLIFWNQINNEATIKPESHIRFLLLGSEVMIDTVYSSEAENIPRTTRCQDPGEKKTVKLYTNHSENLKSYKSDIA